MITTSYIYKNTKRLNDNSNSLDTVLECVDFLDRMGASSFKNWLNGELVAGPTISKFFVRTVFMFPEKLLPDPDFIERLQSMNCIVNLTKDSYQRVEYVRNEITSSNPLTRHLVEHKVWLIEILIPQKYLALDGNTLFNIDGEDIEYEDLDVIYDSEATQQIEANEGDDNDMGGDDFDFGGDEGDEF